MNCISNNNGLATENLVFLNKIFYDNTGTSCPVIYDLTTNTTDYTQQLIISNTANNCGCGVHSGCGGGNHCGNNCGCNCGCNTSSCDFDLCNAQFTVTNSCVTITSTALAAAADFTDADVTVDGLPVTTLITENGRYVADLSGIMAELENCPCRANSHICRDNCTCSSCGSTSCNDCNVQCDNNGHFFLAEVPGPWEVLFTIVLEGYVSNGRCTRDFKLCIKTTNPAGTAVPVTITAANNFALYCVDIPCQSQGVAPSLRFNFESCGMLLNPVLTIAPTTPDPGTTDPVCPAPTNLILTASMIFTPKINLQVVRPTLFALNANEVGTCCDNLGQCDPCAPYMNDCDTCESSGCGCDSNDSCGNNYGCGCNGGIPQLPACQCCNTNGYRF